MRLREDGTVAVQVAAELAGPAEASGGDGCAADCSSIDVGFHCNAMGGPACIVICGDGVRAGGEACDDGNAEAGDGCSASCTIEAGHACNLPAQLCSAIPPPPVGEPTFSPDAGQVAVGRVGVVSDRAAYMCYSTEKTFG